MPSSPTRAIVKPATVPYAYYAKLKPRQKAIYRRSDEVAELTLPGAATFGPFVRELVEALEAEHRASVERASQRLANAVLASFEVPSVRVKVLSTRPSTSSSELHGLYEFGDVKAPATIKVWMRTSHHKRVVAFRTFLRTLLHELCHHLDYRLLKLEDSFHTEGFFKRESSLFKQLVAEPAAGSSPSRARAAQPVAAARGRGSFAKSAFK